MDKNQQDAVLKLTGAQIALTIESAQMTQDFNYLVPDFNQCQGCHVEDINKDEMGLLGFKARHLNKPYQYPTNNEMNHDDQRLNQLNYLVNRQILQSLPDGSVANLPHNADWLDSSASLNDRARSYLDINCGHCHNPTGAADTSGLFLHDQETDALRLGYCKPPVAAGQGTGGRRYAIWPGKADDSILLFRMKSLDLGAMMPELGKSLIHHEGVKLIEGWVNQQQGGC